jgi:hypothetical protein
MISIRDADKQRLIYAMESLDSISELRAHADTLDELQRMADKNRGAA